MRALLIFSVMLAACGADMPRHCKPQHEGGVATLLSFEYYGSDEAETPICVDMYPASRVDATDSSPGLDDSYATSRPNVLPWTNVTFDEAVLACGRGGRFLCNWSEMRASGDYTEIFPGVGGQSYSKPITYLRPTSSEVIDDHAKSRFLITDIARGVGVPNFNDSVAMWTSDHILYGRVHNEFAESGRVQYATRIADPAFKHPLVGFRCCIDARIEDAFAPLGRSPEWLRPAVDPEVPLEPQ